jgi:fucose 4-O-acetylase-like acetyltransferase
MGFFFLISGYFVPRSYDHKGSVSYLKDRLLRLGIPLLVFIFVLNPIASLGIYQMPASLTGITKKLTAASGNFIGNGRWQSAVYTLWDSISSVGMCLGLITVFRRWYNQQGKLRRLMSQQSFTVFIVHIPIVVFLAVLIGGINLENLLKFCLAAIIVVPLCFAVAWLVRKLPGVSKVV